MDQKLTWIEAYAKLYGNRHPTAASLLLRLMKVVPTGAGISMRFQCPEVRENNRLTIHISYHHMNERGFYVGWSDYRIVVRATFRGPTVDVYGQYRRGVKDYLHDLFHHALCDDRRYSLTFETGSWHLHTD